MSDSMNQCSRRWNHRLAGLLVFSDTATLIRLSQLHVYEGCLQTLQLPGTLKYIRRTTAWLGLMRRNQEEHLFPVGCPGILSACSIYLFVTVSCSHKSDWSP